MIVNLERGGGGLFSVTETHKISLFIVMGSV